MKKIKLPRKRKKAFIKAHSVIDYIAFTITNEILCEEKDTNKARSYYDLIIVPGKWEPQIVKKW